MSNAEYRAREGISSSDLKNMMKSMAYYKYVKENPQSKDNQALLFGRAYHKYMLEMDDFFEEFAIAPACDRRTKDGKAQWDQFCKENADKDIITQADFEVIKEMREALMSTPYVKLLIKGEHEKSFFWTDEKTGIPCKCRPDSFGQIKDQYIAVDLKTTTCAETDSFMRQANKLGYDIQAVHYRQGLETHYGKPFKFVFIAQEKTAPYLVNVLEADEYFMQGGEELRDMLLGQYKKALETGEYPGYMTDGINTLSAPNWLKKAMESENMEEFE